MNRKTYQRGYEFLRQELIKARREDQCLCDVEVMDCDIGLILYDMRVPVRDAYVWRSETLRLTEIFNSPK